MEPVIRINGLSKHYGDKTAVNNVNLDVYAGQIIGYIGPNGAGKSTTVKVLAGIIQDFEGSVTVDGLDLGSNVLEIKKRIGYIPEVSEIYDLLTPREYLTFVGKLFHMSDELIEDRSTQMLNTFGILPEIDKRMDGFSKGMRQKVLITAGLLHNPDIIIMDEPLSGLDANAVIMVKELLQILKSEGKTIFYCSHMMDVVEKVSDRIVLISSGSIIADGTIDELRKDSNDSLEKIFSQLTSNGDIVESAGNFASVFKDNQENIAPNE